MANRKGSAFGTAFAIGCGIAAGVAVYRNRERIRGFIEELTGAAAAAEAGDTAAEAPAEPETTDIVIDRSGDGEDA